MAKNRKETRPRRKVATSKRGQGVRGASRLDKIEADMKAYSADLRKFIAKVRRWKKSLSDAST